MNPNIQPPRRTPALRKALEFLDAHGITTIPTTLQDLAARADVSYVTMWKAMRTVRRQQLTGEQSPRFRRTTPGPIVPRDVRPAWQRLKTTMEKDLIQGRLPSANILPRIKELCARYHVGFRTMRAALDALCAEGTVTRAGRVHSALVKGSEMGSTKIGLLVLSWYDGPLVLYEYGQDYVRELDEECFRRRINLEILRYRTDRKPLEILDSQGDHEINLGSRKECAGYAVLIFGLHCRNDGLFLRLRGTGKPVVIVDETRDRDLPACLAGRALHIDARSYERAGREVGRAVLGHGHTRAAFFSVCGDDPWSGRCLAGVSEAFQNASVNALVPFVAPGTQLDNTYADRARNRYSEVPLRESFARWKRHAPRTFSRQLEPHFGPLLDQQMGYAEVRQTVQEFFAKAASDTSIACWIAADIDIAWFADEYRREHNLPISLVTFGDSPEITKRRIATYDFAPSSAAAATVEHLLYPDRKLPGQEGDFFGIDGRLLMRESLRQAGSLMKSPAGKAQWTH